MSGLENWQPDGTALALAAAGGLLALLLLLCGRGKRRSPAKAAPYAVALACFGAAFGFGGAMLAGELGQYRQGAEAYREAEALAAADAGASSRLPVDFEALRLRAPEVIAWLTVPGTAIHYPVVQGKDNHYYLTHLYDGTENRLGSLFVDARNRPDFTDRHTILYGHNMKDGSMFSPLPHYAGQDFFCAHPTAELATPEGSYRVELFAAFQEPPGSAGDSGSPWRRSWESDGDYEEWLSVQLGRSAVEAGVAVTARDRVLTLSTCTDDGSERFLVMGRLLPIGEAP